MKRTNGGTEVGVLCGAAHGPSFDGIGFICRVYRNGDVQTRRIYRRALTPVQAGDGPGDTRRGARKGVIRRAVVKKPTARH